MFHGDMIKNIGFISTRFQGTDGVSLETEKWSYVLERMGYKCFYYAGQSNWDKKRTTIVSEAFFEHPKVLDIQKECFGTVYRSTEQTKKIHELRYKLKNSLYDFIRKKKINMLIVENAMSIPLNIPFGLAITELIAETSIPTIAHHHDFYWERIRFSVTSIHDYLSMSFPPNLPSISHIVINTQANKELSYRTGISATVIPNVFQYGVKAPGKDEYNKNIRKELGLKNDDIFFLQPTRMVARKGIEHSIELVQRLKNKKAKIVITHSAKDEGMEYHKRIISYAKLLKVKLLLKPEIIGEKRGKDANGNKLYTLWDIYPHADFITYPSSYEGFGNAFLEAVFFRKPILVNRYAIYQQDIEPIGFEVVAMDNYITDKTVKKVKSLLQHPEKVSEITDNNYHLAQKFFSYELLEKKLKSIIINFEGVPKKYVKKRIN